MLANHAHSTRALGSSQEISFYLGDRRALTAEIVRLRFFSVAAGFLCATATNKASTMISCAILAAAFSPVRGHSTPFAQSQKAGCSANPDIGELVTATILAPFFRAC